MSGPTEVPQDPKAAQFKMPDSGRSPMPAAPQPHEPSLADPRPGAAPRKDTLAPGPKSGVDSKRPGNTRPAVAFADPPRGVEIPLRFFTHPPEQAATGADVEPGQASPATPAPGRDTQMSHTGEPGAQGIPAETSPKPDDRHETPPTIPAVPLRILPHDPAAPEYPDTPQAGEEDHEDPRPLSKVSMGLFINVSRRAAAIPTRQGALIADYCDKHGLDPQKMKEALLADTEALLKIVEMGNRAHTEADADAAPLIEFTVRLQVKDSFNAGKSLLKNKTLRNYFLSQVRESEANEKPNIAAQAPSSPQPATVHRSEDALHEAPAAKGKEPPEHDPDQPESTAKVPAPGADDAHEEGPRPVAPGSPAKPPGDGTPEARIADGADEPHEPRIMTLDPEYTAKQAELRRQALEQLRREVAQANENDPYADARGALLDALIARDTDMSTMYAVLMYALLDETTASLHKYKDLQGKGEEHDDVVRTTEEQRIATQTLEGRIVIDTRAGVEFQDAERVYRTGEATYAAVMAPYREAAERALAGREYAMPTGDTAFDAYYTDREIEATRMMQRHLYEARKRIEAATQEDQTTPDTQRRRKDRERRKRDYEPIHTAATEYVRNNPGWFRRYTYDASIHSPRASLDTAIDTTEGPPYRSIIPDVTVTHSDGTTKNYNVHMSAGVSYPDRTIREEYVSKENIIPEDTPDALKIETIWVTDLDNPEQEMIYVFFNGTSLSGERIYGISEQVRGTKQSRRSRHTLPGFRMRAKNRRKLLEIIEQLPQFPTESTEQE